MLRKETALPSWIAMHNCWNRYCVSFCSLMTALIRLPSSWMNSMDCWSHAPPVSMAMETKMFVSLLLLLLLLFIYFIHFFWRPPAQSLQARNWIYKTWMTATAFVVDVVIECVKKLQSIAPLDCPGVAPLDCHGDPLEELHRLILVICSRSCPTSNLFH